MSRQVELVRAVLGEACRSDADALWILEESEALGVDALHLCGHWYGLSAEIVASRAAAWAGFSFTTDIPRFAVEPVDHLNGLADIRTIRTRGGSGGMRYLAAGLESLISLRSAVEERPGLVRLVTIVTASRVREAAATALESQLTREAQSRLALHWPNASARYGLTKRACMTFVVVLIIGSALTLLAPVLLQPILVFFAGLLLIIPAAIKLVATALSDPNDWADAAPLADSRLPLYSILIPLRDEAHMVPQIRQAMCALDYPAEKLDIKFVVEAASSATIAAVRRVLDDPRFELVVVPDSRPRTKPKAMNYALPLVRGAHVVVFDAEDVPDPDQLRKAASRFAAEPEVDCLQAELLIDNARENVLTALFAGEYASQFGLMLPLLSRWKMPMPLGGTSNHFRTRALREIGGWDAFNVTEDADLGVRMARLL